ncbi:protein enabled homolog [Monomorium pharaonis]|uniref:protein enabled homolog n=1 Tax=Monomorium pharaonis TaxID=307658 RepID=UPI001746B4BB|nr:protein enabled homolog [Monomorium pharaonis]
MTTTTTTTEAAVARKRRRRRKRRRCRRRRRRCRRRRSKDESRTSVFEARHKEDRRRLMERSSGADEREADGRAGGERGETYPGVEAEGRAINSQNGEGYSRGWPHISPPAFPTSPAVTAATITNRPRASPASPRLAPPLPLPLPPPPPPPPRLVSPSPLHPPGTPPFLFSSPPVSAALGVDLPRYGDRAGESGGAPLASSMPSTSAFWGAPEHIYVDSSTSTEILN